MRKGLAASIVLLSLAVSCTARKKAFTLSNSAMEPTIMQGETFAVEMMPFQPTGGDLIIFEHEDELLVKRVIAMSGDTVQGRNLQVFVNGKLLDEPYVEHVGRRPLDIKTLEAFGPISVPAGMLFVAGDNRDFSFDSRDPRFGLVPATDVKGRPLEILKSPNPQRVHKTLRSSL